RFHRFGVEVRRQHAIHRAAGESEHDQEHRCYCEFSIHRKPPPRVRQRPCLPAPQAAFARSVAGRETARAPASARISETLASVNAPIAITRSRTATSKK